MAQEKTIMLTKYGDIIAANHAKDTLKENGIECFLKDENVMGLDPVGGVELWVFEKDKAEAAKIIAGLV